MSSRITENWGHHVANQEKWVMKYGNLVSAAFVGGVFCLTPIAAALAQTATNQTSAAQADDKGEVLEEVTVRGYRSALAAAQSAKRTSAVVVEAITPEDLGKFTDNSIADELQRVPGVQIDRGTDGRSGDHISVRGIGAEYITTTINGRTPGGYGKEGQQFLREFAVDVLPAEVLSGARVYKTSSADMVEAGLGGAVDYQTLRPLDYETKNGEAYFGSLTGKAQQNRGAGSNKWGDSVSGIVGGHLAEDTVGFVQFGHSAAGQCAEPGWQPQPSVSDLLQ
jgi:iron complex outermembrane receptor protein